MIESLVIGAITTGAIGLGATATRIIADLFKKEEVKKYTVEDIICFCKNANLFRKLEEDKENIIYPTVLSIEEDLKKIEIKFDSDFFRLQQFQERQETFQNHFKEAKLIDFGYDEERNIVVTMFKQTMKNHYGFEYKLCSATDFYCGVNIKEEEKFSSLRRGLLIAGNIGMGKTSIVQGIILNRLWNNLNNPDTEKVKISIVDLKATDMIFFQGYKDIEQVAINIEEMKEVLKKEKEEMERRAKIFRENKVNSIEEYNEKSKVKMNFRYLVVDEIASLQQIEKKERDFIEKEMIGLSSRMRSFGQVLIICTQRPDSNSINSFIKSQVSNTIIGLGVNNKYSSEIIKNSEGLELIKTPGRSLVVDKEGETMTQFQYLSSKELKMRLVKDIKRGKTI